MLDAKRNILMKELRIILTSLIEHASCFKNQTLIQHILRQICRLELLDAMPLDVLSLLESDLYHQRYTLKKLSNIKGFDVTKTFDEFLKHAKQEYQKQHKNYQVHIKEN